MNKFDMHSLVPLPGGSEAAELLPGSHARIGSCRRCHRCRRRSSTLAMARPTGHHLCCASVLYPTSFPLSLPPRPLTRSSSLSWRRSWPASPLPTATLTPPPCWRSGWAATCGTPAAGCWQPCSSCTPAHWSLCSAANCGSAAPLRPGVRQSGGAGMGVQPTSARRSGRALLRKPSAQSTAPHLPHLQLHSMLPN